jgi:hypothetical protein
MDQKQNYEISPEIFNLIYHRVRYFVTEIVFENLELPNKTLYHYTSVDALISILQNKGSFFLTDTDFLNDRMERSLFLPEFYKKHKEEHIQQDDRFYCLSFSTLNDSIPMWNHYGKGDGICLGFDVQYPTKIIYIDKEEVHGYLEHFNSLLSDYFNSEIKNLLEKKGIKDQLDNLHQDAYFYGIQLMSDCTKNKDFMYENEYRIYKDIYDDIYTKEVAHYRSINGRLKPFVKSSFADLGIKFKSIKISPLNTDDTLEKGLHLMLNTYGYSEDIKISKSQLTLRL